MKLEEAIVYLLSGSGQGMRTEQIAREINEQGIYQRWDKEPRYQKSRYGLWYCRIRKPLSSRMGGYG